jgi:hypothetical protein
MIGGDKLILFRSRKSTGMGDVGFMRRRQQKSTGGEEVLPD